jgi:thiol:disulfide interchange protein
MKRINIGFIVLFLFGFSTVVLPATVFAKDVKWQSFADGMARGKSENKKIFLHFYAKWCGPCKIMEKKTFKDPGVIASLNSDFIPIKVDIDKDQQTSNMFRVKSIPDTWFLAENNDIIGHRMGYISPEQLKVIFKMIMDEETEQ